MQLRSAWVVVICRSFYCRKNTNSKANLSSPMFWHEVLQQYLIANTFNRIIRLRISVFTVTRNVMSCTHAKQTCYHLVNTADVIQRISRRMCCQQCYIVQYITSR
jgi:hypothetical protein